MDKLEALRVLGFKYLTKDTFQETDMLYNKYVVAWKMIPQQGNYEDEYGIYGQGSEAIWEYTDEMDKSEDWFLHMSLPIESFEFMIGREDEVVVIKKEIDKIVKKMIDNWIEN